jgi:hypothetical protein
VFKSILQLLCRTYDHSILLQALLLFLLCIGHAGTEIATIEARDADSGDFGRVTYLLDRMSSQVINKLDQICLM